MSKNIDKKKYQQVQIIVGAFIFNEQNELLLLKSKHYNNEYICPGGHVELNEYLLEAVKREVKEETNLNLSDIEFLSVSETVKLDKKYHKKDVHHVYINYRAKVKKNKKIKLNNEAVDYEWQSLEAWKKEKKLKPSIKQVLIELEQEGFENRYKRALADYQNLLKRSAKEKEDFAKYANEQLLHSLIPVYDNLKTSLQHTDDSLRNHPWVEGVRYVVKQFATVLEENGVQEIKTIGEKFDPKLMEAMSGKGDRVVKELRPGYKLRDKVIVPAKVEVAEK